MKDPEESVSDKAVWGLLEIGKSVVPHVVDVLFTVPEAYKIKLVYVLGRTGDVRGVNHLLVYWIKVMMN